MKNIFYSILFTFLINSLSAQSKQDYFEYIVNQTEGSSSKSNYTTIVALGNQISKSDAEKFTGTRLNDDQYQNLFIVASEIYADKTKTNKFLEIIRTIDMSGIRKVTTKKSQNNEGNFYQISIYVNDGFICREWGSNDRSAISIDHIDLNVRTDESTAINIKKA